MQELEALVALTHTPLLGAAKIRALIDHVGSAAEVWSASSGGIAALAGVIGPRSAEALEMFRGNEEWKRTFDLALAAQVDLISYKDPRYPKRLLEIPDFPVLLYVKGALLPKDQRCIAVVGTRHHSIYGAAMAEKLSQDLASGGITIVSGLARGIDTIAHQAALAQGRTVAVIGSGLAQIYPRENIRLAEEIAQRGALISEFPMMLPPDRQNFPQRNRIVSGMTLGTVLVEAPLKSGAMITMNKGFSQGRRLFALPGRADTENFRGNHFLIKSGQAQLIEGAQDVLEAFDGLFPGASKLAFVDKRKIFLDEEEENLLAKMPAEELTIEELAQMTQLSSMKLSVLLMGLVLKNVIREFPGKVYKKL